MREMKDSGIEWLGGIPVGWKINKIKYLTQSRYEKYKLSEVNQYIGLENVEKGTGHYVESESEYEDGVYDGCEKGDLLYGKLRPNLAKAMIAPFRACCTGEFEVISHCSIGLKYLQYYMLTDGFTHTVTSSMYGAKMPRANWDFIKNIEIAFPDESERDTIVKHLDTKCAEIDALTEDIQSQIDTLEQYKRSVITEAVTKGLDHHAEMKDSGIEWVGEIPTTWNIHPVYYYFGERRNKNYALAEQNLLSLSYGRVIRKSIDTVGGLLPASFNTYNIVEAGDIIIRPTDLQNDKRSLRTGLVTELGIITSAYIDLMPKENVNSEYFHYLLHAYDIQKVFYNMGNGVRQGLNYSEFSKLMVIAPPVTEQAQIVEYLDAKCKEINDIINEKKNQLEVLDQYKKSLIYEYVTGKKEL